jgi:hypothetical protein
LQAAPVLLDVWRTLKVDYLQGFARHTSSSVELLKSPTVAQSSRFLRHPDFMVQLSPILPLLQAKNESRTNRLPAFYLAETIEGIQGIVGVADPRSLGRVQFAANAAENSKVWDELLHVVYWSDSPLPKSIAELSKGSPGIAPIPSALQAELNDYLSRATTCAVGNEAKLDKAIAAGVSSVPVVLWNAESRRLPWLPCHRVIHGVKSFQSGWMVCLAREHLFFRDVTAQLSSAPNNSILFDSEVARELLASRESESVTMLAFTSDGAWRLHSEPGWADGLLLDSHSLLREIAAVQLHHIVLPRGLSLPADGSQNDFVEVVHDARAAVASLGDGAQVAYLLNPIRTEQLKELIKQGQMLPSNSVALDAAALEVWKHAE